MAPLRLVAFEAGYLSAGDALVALLLILSFPAYLRQRRRIADREARSLELAWIGLCIVLLLSSTNSPAFSIKACLYNLKFVEGFILYFPTVAIINSTRRVKAIAIYGAILAIVGTGMTVAQSLHGLTNLFDSPFYNVGGWGGNRIIVGGFTRVNLPLSNWVASALLVVFSSILLRFNWKTVLLSGGLFITILLNFARSLWLGLAAGLAVEYFYFYRLQLLTFGAKMRLLFLPVAVLIALYVGNMLGSDDLTQGILARLDEGTYFIAHGSGTWGTRIVGIENALKVWEGSWLFGIGTNYYSVVGQWIDIGFALVLVASGVVGLLALIWLFIRSWLFGVKTMRKGLNTGSHVAIVAGATLVGQVALMVVYQQWLDVYVAPILAFCGGVCTTLGIEEEDSTRRDGE